MKMIKLYIHVPDEKFGKALPDGIVMGIKNFDNTVRHVARLYTNKPVEVKEEDALRLLEKDERVKKWDDSTGKRIAKLVKSIEKKKKKGRNIVNRGPLSQPSFERPPSREAVVPKEKRDDYAGDDEELDEDEAANVLDGESDDTDGEPTLVPETESSVPGDEMPPAAVDKKKKNRG